MPSVADEDSKMQLFSAGRLNYPAYAGRIFREPYLYRIIPVHSSMQSLDEPISGSQHDNEFYGSLRENAEDELGETHSPDIATQQRWFCKLYISRLVEDFAVPQRTARLLDQRKTEATYADVLIAISSFLANSPSPQNPINFAAIADKEPR